MANKSLHSILSGWISTKKVDQEVGITIAGLAKDIDALVPRLLHPSSIQVLFSKRVSFLIANTFMFKAKREIIKIDQLLSQENYGKPAIQILMNSKLYDIAIVVKRLDRDFPEYNHALREYRNNTSESNS